MSDELQNEATNDAPAEDIQQAAPAETIENPKGPDLAPETQSETIEAAAEPTEAEKEQKRQEAFGREYGKTKQAERERDAALAKVAEYEQSKAQKAPQAAEFPNEYDFDTTQEFEEAKTKFVQNVQANERYKQQQSANEYAQQQQIERAQQEYAKQVEADYTGYMESAKKNGISNEELDKAAKAVGSYGITQELVYEILRTPDGDLVTKYLAANPKEVHSLVNMNPYAAGRHLQNLATKAQALKPKTSNTPPPGADIKGSGTKPAKHPELEGVIYS